MISRTNKFALILWVIIAVAVLTLLYLTMQVRERDQVIDRLSRQESSQRQLKTKLEDENRVLRERLLSVSGSVTQKVESKMPQQEQQIFEDELDRWFDRLQRLRRFAGYHPEWSIPEMQFLTANDWLDATKSATLETDADYRQALGLLRYKSKLEVMGKIGEALNKYLTTSSGQLPSNLQQISVYLSQPLDPTILQRYDINPSGKVPGLPEVTGERIAVVERTRVDPIWDGTLWISDTGGVGGIGIDNSNVRDVFKWIEDYRRQHGSEPRDATQVSASVKAKMSPATLVEIFNALIARPHTDSIPPR